MRSRVVFFLACVLAAASPASAYYRPRNPRLRRKAALVRVSSAAAARPLDRLQPGRWNPAIAETLDVAVQVYGRGSVDFDAARRPIAVLPVDDGLIEGDPSELVFQDLVRKAAFKFDDSFWDVVPILYGRQRIRAAYEQFSGLPRDVWDEQPTYHQFVKYFIESYQRMCFEVSRKDCRIYLARLLKGFPRKEALDYAKGVLATEAARPPSIEKLGASSEDPNPVAIRHGFLATPELLDLTRLLERSGFDVWLEDPDPQPVLQAAAQQLRLQGVELAGISEGLSKDRDVSRETMTGKIVEPVPIREGKVDALVSGAGRGPTLALGVSADDLDLLSYGDGLRLVIGSDPALLRAAAQRHWRVQPAFR